MTMDEIEFIAENFESGISRNHLRKGYRSTKVKSHIIFYKKSSENSVEIMRVLLQKMDIENRLND